jgi:hypothetical protein
MTVALWIVAIATVTGLCVLVHAGGPPEGGRR